MIPTASIAEEKALGGILLVNINTSLSLTKAAHYTPLLRSRNSKERTGGRISNRPSSY